MTVALLIIDVQNDYFPGGAGELPEMRAAADICGTLLQTFRSAGLPVVHIRHHGMPPWAQILVAGTAGSDIHDVVRPTASEPVVVKTGPNAFCGTALLGVLRRIGACELILCGARTETCVAATARAAVELGFGVSVAADGCASSPLAWQGQTIGDAEVQAVTLAGLQTVARVQPAAAVIDHIRPRLKAA